MDLTAWLAVVVIALAVAGVIRGLDVRLVLFLAALVLGGLAGDLAPIVRQFVATFSDGKFVVPICSAMGFAYVLKYTGCDQHLVRILVEPVRRVRFLMVPGVVLVGFVVNVPVISQTSTAVCLGTVVVPVMRAAGFSPLAIGAALLLGASVGGELLNPGAPELLTVSSLTKVPTTGMWQQILPLVLPVLAVSTLVLWGMTAWGERGDPHRKESGTGTGRGTGAGTGEEQQAGFVPLPVPDEPLNPLKALVPLVPLALLFVTGPPLELVSIPQRWAVVRPPEAPSAAVAGPAAAHALEAKKDPVFSSRLIGLAMLVGVGVAALAVPSKAKGCARVFFEGAGYGFTHIVSLIVTASCFGKGIEQVGLADHLGDLIAASPGLLQPLAGVVPCAFAFVSGSGMASTQSLYGFFYYPAVELSQDPVEVGAMVSVGSAAGRTMSPVAAVTLMCATLTGAKPFDLVRRVGPPLVAGLAAAIALRVMGVV
ncbi:MAG TPA: C4-dicarboxylate transporter DcuC [Fimbriiglobus sp.]|jgi:DcuC family C4-dicarboxylate transporter|nr:C4-dicarboxylate transporter DcuC [Fimbriiglobus sp.]